MVNFNVNENLKSIAGTIALSDVTLNEWTEIRKSIENIEKIWNSKPRNWYTGKEDLDDKIRNEQNQK